MKYFSLLIAIIFSVSTHAQVMQAKPVWVSINVPQLKCWECQQRLNQYLVREKGPNTDAGIGQWKMDLRNGILKIQYYPDRMTVPYLRTAIANAGFDADTVTAEPDAYKRLPNPCKKASDGSGFGPFKYCNLDPADRPKD